MGTSSRSYRSVSLTLVRLLICLQIHLIPYGTVSILSIMVLRNVFAISINMVNRGTMMAWTSLFAAAVSGGTPRGSDGGRVPVSSSICWIICSYTCRGGERKRASRHSRDHLFHSRGWSGTGAERRLRPERGEEAWIVRRYSCQTVCGSKQEKQEDTSASARRSFSRGARLDNRDVVRSKRVLYPPLTG